MNALYTWEDTERQGLDDLPQIAWEPVKSWLPVPEVRELFGRAGWTQWELAVKLQEKQK